MYPAVESDAVLGTFAGAGFVPVPYPPRIKAQCLPSGWQNIVAPYAFKNRGECISFVSAGR